MGLQLEILFTPAEFERLCPEALAQTTCVVFDVLRATSVFVTALGNGAAAIIPTESIPAALAAHQQHPTALLAGERNGLRITAAQSGGREFDLGNSPREFTADKVAAQTIIATTTNGTRALRACHGASQVLAASWLNLAATVNHCRQFATGRLLGICSGTGEAAALEDALAAGEFCQRFTQAMSAVELKDSAQIARRLYLEAAHDLRGALQTAHNARRLRAHPELAADVDFCLQHDRFSLVAAMGADGAIRTWK